MPVVAPISLAVTSVLNPSVVVSVFGLKCFNPRAVLYPLILIATPTQTPFGNSKQGVSLTTQILLSDLVLLKSSVHQVYSAFAVGALNLAVNLYVLYETIRPPTPNSSPLPASFTFTS